MQMPERDIENAIDRAVRDLMNVDADTAFRARVSARLDRPSRHGLSWRYVVLAGGAAAIVLAVLMMHRSTPGTEPPVTAENAPPPVAPAPTAVRESPAAANAPAREPVRRATVRITAPARTFVPPIAPNTIVAAVAPDEPAVDIEPLTATTPIVVAPVEPRQIATQDIAVSPLADVREIQVAPLTPRSERD
jgi:hypothetical protein